MENQGDLIDFSEEPQEHSRNIQISAPQSNIEQKRDSAQLSNPTLERVGGDKLIRQDSDTSELEEFVDAES